MPNNLYNRDFNLWINETTSALKSREFSRVDWDNLIEEIEDMGESQQRAIESLLLRLTEHLIKLKYWEVEKERNKKHW